MYEWYKNEQSEEERYAEQIFLYEMYEANRDDYEDYDACNEWCNL